MQLAERLGVLTIGGAWIFVHEIRHREANNARHLFVSWNLILGKNLLRVATQHGHGVQTMLDTYAAWIDGSREEDIEAIRRAMEARPVLLTGRPSRDWNSSPQRPFAFPAIWHWINAETTLRMR